MRSTRPDVRNPLVKLPSVARVVSLPPEAKAALKALLIDIRNDCREHAAESLRKHKAPMYAYWKANGVYANHMQRLLK